jgi:serine/threonine protein kinase
MEYIEGEPIDRYCDGRGLTIAARLALFRDVCAAVHYAHQRLVVHRDIKPANVLVTPAGVPKLLDFGIAKLLTADADGRTATPTAFAARAMTPEYASPEQVRGEVVTTLSDIYSLGVLLYELLAGRRPYLTHRVSPSTPEEVARVVSETEPLRPSAVAADERTRRALRGDLDTIVLAALR